MPGASHDQAWRSDHTTVADPPETIEVTAGTAPRVIGGPTEETSFSMTNEGVIAARAGLARLPTTVYGAFQATALTPPGGGVVKVQTPETVSSTTLTGTFAE